ncbi:hypothetical protein CYY_003623 [Polysphondylium violaceum]|uniref:Uncharacterized protein n=1 Tax=Polysphondylium violaceum TaxID=133409 RepID=A0A8J4Q6K4_9MYCE|nr:hypothetical protein CYY_003623 [Polysphondylium violaceum]
MEDQNNSRSNNDNHSSTTNHFFSIFRNKPLNQMVMEVISKNINISYDFYRLPLHLVIANKRYDYLVYKIDKYLEWRASNHATEWYLELSKHDIKPLFSVAHLIGYDKFMVLYKDFESLFDTVLLKNDYEICSTDFKVFQHFYKLYQKESFSNFEKFLSNITEITNVEVFEALMINISKHPIPTLRNISKEFLINLDTKPQLIKVFCQLLATWVSPKYNFNNDVNNLINFELTQLAREYIYIIPKNTYFVWEKLFRPYPKSLRKKYETFQIIFQHNPNYFKTYGTDGDSIFNRFYIPHELYLSSRDCLDFAIARKGSDFKLDDTSRVWISDAFMTKGDMDGVLLLHKLDLFKFIFDVDTTLPILKFCIEFYNLKLNTVCARGTQPSFVGDFECYKYIYEKFPSLSANPFLFPHLAKCKTASKKLTRLLVENTTKISIHTLTLALLNNNFQLFKILWENKEEKFKDQNIESLNSGLMYIFNQQQTDTLEYFLKDPILAPILIKYVNATASSIPRCQLEKLTKYYFQLDVKLLPSQYSISQCFTKNMTNIILYKIATNSYSDHHIRVVINKSLNLSYFNQFKKLLTGIIDHQPTINDKSKIIFIILFSSIKRGLIDKLIQLFSNPYPSIKLENIEQNFFSLSPGELLSLQKDLDSLLPDQKNYLIKIGFYKNLNNQTNIFSFNSNTLDSHNSKKRKENTSLNELFHF